MWKYILKIIDRLFGKIFDDIGKKLFNQYKKLFKHKISIYDQLINLPYVRYGDDKCYYGKCYNLKSRNELLEKTDYKIFCKKLNFFNKKRLLKKLINNFEINSWNECDKYLTSLIILFDSLNPRKLYKIYQDIKDSNQTQQIFIFFQEIQKIKPKLINKKLRIGIGHYLKIQEEIKKLKQKRVLDKGHSLLTQ